MVTTSPANVVPTNQLRKGGVNLFIRWKVKGWSEYAYLEKRVRDKGKVSTKLVVYLGKHPSSKLEAMLRLGQITAKEIADISYIIKNDPPDFEDTQLEGLISRCREAFGIFILQQTILELSIRRSGNVCS
jgi:hypothetical protein